ncbi:MAG TPA: heat-inducible transcriptional repressor HrcA [Gaiellaceae bacterium]|jgi:heat-inducible transcriptional repressor
MSTHPELTDRQREVLARVVEEYVATSVPVGSRSLVERAGFAVSASTVRAELAELERIGLLTHPHTSAGRVPTEAGYRIYVDGLLARQEPRPAGFPLELTSSRSDAEVDEALQATTEMLSSVTRLLALVSAPPIEAATVHHVDVLQLQPNVVVVVVITSTGGVTKQRYAFPEMVDPGLVTWAGDYLRERLTGLRLRSRMLARAFDEPSFSSRERTFLAAVRGAFDDVEDERELYVGGAAGLLDDLHSEEIGAYRSLIDALEKRAALLDVLAQSLGLRRPFVRVGDELEDSGLRQLALVGATYGFANQALGTVSLLGPLRMDYEKALRAVRSAAYELSRFVEEVYAED